MSNKSVVEKTSKLLQGRDDPEFPHITYRRGASGTLSPVLRGTGLRVQTIALDSQNKTPADIAEDYDLPLTQVHEALGFYDSHRVEIDAQIQAEAALDLQAD
jgi:uncharacterized protein (DUF433 family)